MESPLIEWVDVLEEPGPLGTVAQTFLERVAVQVQGSALGLFLPLGETPLLVASTGGLDASEAQDLCSTHGWPVAGGHLVARPGDGLRRDLLALAARLLESHLGQRRSRARDERGQMAVAASTHEINNMLMPLYSSPSEPVLRAGQRMKLQLDCLRSLRGREPLRDLQRVPGLLERVKAFLGWRPGGKHPVDVSCSPEAKARLVGPGVDLLPLLVNVGYALREQGDSLSLRAFVEDDVLAVSLEADVAEPRDLLGGLDVAGANERVSVSASLREGRVRVCVRSLCRPRVLFLHGPAPTGSLTEALDALAVETILCQSADEVLEHVRADPACLVVATEDAPAGGLKRSLMLIDAHLALHGFFTVGGLTAPGADVRGQVDLGALLAEAAPGGPVVPPD